MRLYGLPYKGTKQKLADSIIRLFPPAETFFDVFCGGGAVSHCAALSGKFKEVRINDLRHGQADAVKTLLSGSLVVPKKWVSREEFFKKRFSDPLVRVIWSFGNDGYSYLYAREIEPWKRAVFYAIALGDYSQLQEMGITQKTITRKWIAENTPYCAEKYIAWIKPKLGITPEIEGEFRELVKSGKIDMNFASGVCRIQHATAQLRSLTPNADVMHSIMVLDSICNSSPFNKNEALERIQALKADKNLVIEATELDYRNIKGIGSADVVYADPPYENTSGYGKDTGRFDSKSFWQWCRELPCIALISSYKAPDDFIPVAEFKHCSSINSGNKLVTEKVFLYKEREDEYKTMTCWGGVIRDKSGQLDLF